MISPTLVCLRSLPAGTCTSICSPAGVTVLRTATKFSALGASTEVSAGEILGSPVVSEFPHYRSLARNPLAAFQAVAHRAAEAYIDIEALRRELHGDGEVGQVSRAEGPADDESVGGAEQHRAKSAVRRRAPRPCR